MLQSLLVDPPCLDKRTSINCCVSSSLKLAVLTDEISFEFPASEKQWKFIFGCKSEMIASVTYVTVCSKSEQKSNRPKIFLQIFNYELNLKE